MLEKWKNDPEKRDKLMKAAAVLIILAVVLLNAALGVIQESKAEAAIEALQTMTAATSKVLRDGAVAELESSRLVPGDVVMLEAGDAVPADGRLLACASLQIEEAALTGESVPSTKSTDPLTGDVPLGDRRNMAYMGSTVSYGRGRMVVTATGMDTEMGKIAGVLARTEQEETPLQKKLTQLGKTLSWLVLGICVFIFVFDLLVAGDLFVLADGGTVYAAGRINREQVPVYAEVPWAHDVPPEQVLVLHTLVVDPAVAGHGCGTQFVRFYEQRARALGCPELRIDTNAKNANARRLYAYLGYREAGVAPCTFNGIDGVALVCLEKWLGAEP